MKFHAIDNIWTVDLSLLPNADRGRVYFERAKQVITITLLDPIERQKAVHRGRFRRSYLIAQIGAQPAVVTQNPQIKELLTLVDRMLGANSIAAAEE